jgi:hypothetical protein
MHHRAAVPFSRLDSIDVHFSSLLFSIKYDSVVGFFAP